MNAPGRQVDGSDDYWAQKYRLFFQRGTAIFNSSVRCFLGSAIQITRRQKTASLRRKREKCCAVALSVTCEQTTGGVARER